jgi:hypothetical protein
MNDNADQKTRHELYLITIREEGRVLLARPYAERFLREHPGYASNIYANPPPRLVTVRPVRALETVR